MATDEELSMMHAISKLAPNSGIEMAGIVALLGPKNLALAVDVDWPAFLGCSQAELDQVYEARLAWYRAEREAWELHCIRSERIKAGLARRRAEGKPVGRQPGAKDRKQRRRSGYVARYERGRDG